VERKTTRRIALGEKKGGEEFGKEEGMPE